MKTVAYFVGWTILILSNIWSGYVLSVLWAWFIAPTFHIVAISIPVAIGFSLVVNFLTHEMSSSGSGNKDDSTSTVMIKGITFALFYPLLVLGMGAAVHAFM